MTQNSEEILSKIEPFICGDVDVNQLQVHTVLARELITWNRFDLAFKLFFIEMQLLNPSLGEKYYEQHLRAFGLGQIREPGNPLKSSLEQFISEFNNIFKSIRECGFRESISLLPLALDGSIANGAHRLAAAIYLNLRVSVLNTKLPTSLYDYKYFKERNVSSEILDLMACKFVEHSRNTYIAFLWPSIAGYEKEVEKFIPRIVYKKELKLNINGAHNLLTQIYRGEDWIGNFENGYAGINGKMNECFGLNKTLTVIAFQANSLEDVVNIKSKVRSKFKLGKHSIHITDNFEESIDISRLVFNDNSIHFLNYAKPYKFFDNKEILKFIRRKIYDSSTPRESVVIDGGAVLSLYGIRKSSDIDYISTSRINEHYSDLFSFESHLNQLTYHQTAAENLIWDPHFYFWFEGLKFISLNQIYEMKKKRDELKDRVDCSAISALIKNQNFKIYIIKVTQNFLYFKLKIYFLIYYFLKKFGLLNFVKKFLKR